MLSSVEAWWAKASPLVLRQAQDDSPFLSISKCCIAIAILLSGINNIYAQKLSTFPLSSVRLLESPFKDAQETDKKYILSLNPDRLLAPFLREAGIQPKAKNYGNWEGTGLDGHIGGHYLSALSNMYAATGDKGLLRRINYMVDELEKCQQKNGNGYIGGVPGGNAMWPDVAAGKIHADAFSLNGKWVPLYNIHKLYAGLIDAYRIAGNQKAKKVLTAYADWGYNVFAKLTDAQVQDILRSEHGGMNEAFADIANITGDKKYLELAKRLSHHKILAPLLLQQDSLTGMHANTQIPKVIGFMRIAGLDNDTSWAGAANFFWNTVVKHRTVAFGGNSVREHFNPADNFSSMIETREGPETCNSYNMLKLSKLLFLNKPSADYVNYYERTLYNHILSSQSPKGGFVYFTPIRPQHYKVYSSAHQSFWCCVGSGLENHGKYGELIYSHSDKDIYVNLFIPSTLNWKERGINLTQTTQFPYAETSSIKLSLKNKQVFAVHIRYAEWVRPDEMQVMVNGEAQPVKTDALSYISLNRTWKNGDEITVKLPMHNRAEQLPDGSNWVAFTHGPIVLAAATDTTGLKGLHADDSRMGHIASGPLRPLEDAPLLVSAKKDIAEGIKTVNGSKLVFSAENLINQDKYKHLKLVPFYTLYNTRYVIYWPYTDEQGLVTMRKAMKEKEEALLALDKITVDHITAGEQQPETDHNFKSESSEAGSFNDLHFRNAKGWFSYDMRNTGNVSRKLRLTYRTYQDRAFDIYVNGSLLTSLTGEVQNGKITTGEYPLPESVQKSNTIQVKIVARPNAATADVFELRLLK
ncbi:MAG: glycosyl hydrolase [Sphingobacteriaceae bacterium]|nr:MAG: glycosyl hydrolase [Sphingobacteriaceae bacterium]